MPLVAKSLRKAAIPPAIILNPSPGNLQSTRLALRVSETRSSCSVFIASGCHVYKVEVSMDKSTVTEGKESLLIPDQAEVLSSHVVDRCPHRSEIQSVTLREQDGGDCSIMGTVDSYGHLIVSRLGTNGADVDRLSYSVAPPDYGVREGSWAGVCFSPLHSSMAAVAHCFGKTIDVYDQDIHLRSLRTLWYPAALSSIQSSTSVNGTSTVLAVAEGSQTSIWDLRANHNGGCVQRVCGSVGDLIYAISSSSSGAIAVGGSDRTVTIYDPRRWSALSRWVNCSKYEITGLHYSSHNPAYIFIQGVDYEVLCGKWYSKEKAFSYRGDSNWLGFSKCGDMDVLAGWCESGSIFVADVVEHQQDYL